MLHKIKYKKIGRHVHCQMFTGYQPGNMGKNGELVFREEEFKHFRKSQYGIIWFEECASEPEVHSTDYDDHDGDHE